MNPRVMLAVYYGLMVTGAMLAGLIGALVLKVCYEGIEAWFFREKDDP